MRVTKYITWAIPMLVLLVGMASCSGSETKDPAVANFKAEPGQSTPIHFSHLTMQFGPVTSGDTVKADYPFKNMTNTAVTIAQAVTSCPCMMTEIPKGPIQPGEVGTIKVRFATAGQMGRHEKIISVVMQGSNEPIPLHLNGQINPK